MPVNRTLHTEEEVRELVRLGAAVGDFEFCPLSDLLSSPLSPIGTVDDILSGLSMWTGHGDESLIDWIARFDRGARPALRLVVHGTP